MPSVPALKKKPAILKKPAPGAKKTFTKPASLSGPSNVRPTTSSKLTEGGRVSMHQDGLRESTRIKVFEVPVARIDEHGENPNEQSEKTFDELVERIKKDGPDEPIIVIPTILNGEPNGRFTIFSGHHRFRAYKAAGLETVDCVIREGWDADRAALELVTRNVLRGQVNPYKFTELFDRLKARYDPELLKKMMGLTEKKQFSALYKRISDNLNPRQKRKLEEAKEDIKSVEDLSSVLNTIFKEHGAELDYGFMVFNFSGKQHHYVRIDDDTNKLLIAIEEDHMSREANVHEFFAEAIREAAAKAGIVANVSKPKALKRT